MNATPRARLAALLQAAMLLLMLDGCGAAPPGRGASATGDSFGADLAFLRQHTHVVLLHDAQGAAQIAVAPAYQGRVMTSTCGGLDGPSFGYLHRPGIAAGKPTPHITVLGGEERFWLGPEGGQYALYFAPGDPFDFDHWQVPQPLDWGAWPVVAQSEHSVSFALALRLTNYAGTRFDLRVERTVQLLDAAAIEKLLGGAALTHSKVVGYESRNRIVNAGSAAWQKDSGLLSIWLLGMFKPGPRTTVVLPFEPGGELGRIVNDAYFGAVAPERLRVGESALFFRADGEVRGKIGIPRPRARDRAGSYDPLAGVLTLVQFSLPADARDYVNALWEQQSDPYAGDVVNSYNDGPVAPGAPARGGFYELETSSPAAALAPGAALEHTQHTLHVQGPPAELDGIARALLGVSLAQIEGALP
jgi:hypothetical protein